MTDNIGPYGQINVNDHGIDTILTVVLGPYGHNVKPVDVIVKAWRGDNHQFLVQFYYKHKRDELVYGSPAWWNAKDIAIVTPVPVEESKELSTDSFPDNLKLLDMTIGQMFVAELGYADGTKKEQRVTLEKIYDSKDTVKLCVHDPEVPRVDVVFPTKYVKPLYLYQETQTDPEEDNEDLEEDSVELTDSDRLKQSFFHHLTMLKKIGKELGYTVDVTL